MPKRLLHLFPFKRYCLKSHPYILCHFHGRHVVKAIQYIIYAETMHDKWKQTPYPIWFLRCCGSKSSNGNEVLYNLYLIKLYSACVKQNTAVETAIDACSLLAK